MCKTEMYILKELNELYPDGICMYKGSRKFQKKHGSCITIPEKNWSVSVFGYDYICTSDTLLGALELCLENVKE